MAYAMTINKAQGQTLTKVGICLIKNVFSHVQLYVAFSGATTPANILVLLESGRYQELGIIQNVVYEEALN